MTTAQAETGSAKTSLVLEQRGWLLGKTQQGASFTIALAAGELESTARCVAAYYERMRPARG